MTREEIFVLRKAVDSFDVIGLAYPGAYYEVTEAMLLKAKDDLMILFEHYF